MAAVLRIKRKVNEEPAEALQLQTKSKKLRPDDNIFRFCGTLKSEDESIETIEKLFQKKDRQLKRLSDYKRRPVSQTKVPSEHWQSRFKLVSRFRGFEENGDVNIKLFDLVSENEAEVVTCNGLPLTVESSSSPGEDSYVYDVYYKTSVDIDDSFIDSLLSVQPYSSNYFYGDEEVEDEDVYRDDEDDSNDENNWRNDYPDSDPDQDELDYEDNIIERLTKVNVDESNLSSDEEEGYAYTLDEDNARHGKAYAAFKKKIARELEEHDDDYEDSDSSSN